MVIIKNQRKEQRCPFFLVLKSGTEDIVPLFINLTESGEIQSGTGGKISARVVERLLELAEAGSNIAVAVEKRNPREKDQSKVEFKLLP